MKRRISVVGGPGLLLAGLLIFSSVATAQDTLTVKDNKVGIRTDDPLEMFHIYGAATADTFAGMGPDPTNGPAFNLGYSGSSFGRSSAFFNVRPDSSANAPNPSLRFLTGNVHRMILDNQGFLGIGGNHTFNPVHPIHLISGAHVTIGGVWTNSSSIHLKENIETLRLENALETLHALTPVGYTYKSDPTDPQLGFIAEHVPESVATPDRTGLAPMDIVAVLTKVVQEQQNQIERLEQRLDRRDLGRVAIDN